MQPVSKSFHILEIKDLLFGMCQQKWLIYMRLLNFGTSEEIKTYLMHWIPMVKENEPWKSS